VGKLHRSKQEINWNYSWPLDGCETLLSILLAWEVAWDSDLSILLCTENIKHQTILKKFLWDSIRLASCLEVNSLKRKNNSCKKLRFQRQSETMGREERKKSMFFNFTIVILFNNNLYINVDNLQCSHFIWVLTRFRKSNTSF
jgi:hypothetical protein